MVLHDAAGDLYVPRSSYGYPEAQASALESLRLSAACFGTLLQALDRHGHVQVRTTNVADAKTAVLLREYGITQCLYVVLRRGTDVIGFLSAGYRGRETPFTAMQERLASGIGQLASMALENARLVEELRHASRVKSEFVSTMSHELRTPLSVILGYTDMLRDDGLGETDHTRTLDRIRTAALELLEMIEATLNLGRMEAGNDPARFEPVAMDELLGELAIEFGALTQRPGTALRWEPTNGIVADTDRRKLRIVVKNLVGNALKFTPHGEVVVRSEVRGDRCAIVVRDTGVGIAAERLPLIFEMFRQGDSSDSRSYSGVGLGLYIVQRVLDQLGGQIAVASAPGRGSTFTVTIPLRANGLLSATA